MDKTCRKCNSVKPIHAFSPNGRTQDCPHEKSHVIDSGPPGTRVKNAAMIKCIRTRRHECLKCGFRFTTYELTERQVKDIVSVKFHECIAAMQDFIK